MPAALEDAVEVVRADVPGPASAFLTCEHASERLPEPWSWPDADRRLVGTHWAYDIGASDLTRELAEALGTTAVLARFSRLLVDPNRPLDSPTLFRDRADGVAVALNSALTEDEKRTRITRLWEQYHQRVDAELRQSSAPVVLAVHTFTPEYEGRPRAFEVGVLFDTEVALAEAAHAAIARAGLAVEMNEPYSGFDGMMYSADRHARAERRRAIEIEVRQDLAVEATLRQRLVDALTKVLAEVP